MLMDINRIKVGKRVRKELENIEQLKESIRKYGLLNPITVNTKNELIAGNRRLEALRQLGWTEVPVVIASINTKVHRLEVELEENLQRLDFKPDDLRKGLEKLHRLQNPGFLRRIWNAIVAFFSRIFFR